ncbi:MAG: branched-chain amino acid ABC transporter permease [Solirubrobacteraceae bacterium]|nr:branched-chain amino acid ABC transporter permease [Solirubrobacteraceae bacterium]
MSPETIRTIFDVASLTSILVLLVLGMAVIVGMMQVFNLCQGELVLLGAVVAYVAHEWLGSVLLGILVAPFAVAAFGAVLERTVIRRFYANAAGALLATFAVGFLIRAIVLARMSSQGEPVPAPIDGTVGIGGADVSAWRLVIIVVVVLAVAATYLSLTRTAIGLRVRATLDDVELAAASGISTRRMFTGTYAFGAALAGLAGAMIVPLQALYPSLGFDNLVPMFLSVMVGGLGTLHGPLLGAVALGVPTALLPTWIDSVLSQVLVIFAAIVFMRLRPGGLVNRDI